MLYSSPLYFVVRSLYQQRHITIYLLYDLSAVRLVIVLTDVSVLLLVTSAWKPVSQSALYLTFRTLPSGSTREYSPLTTSPSRSSS